MFFEENGFQSTTIVEGNESDFLFKRKMPKKVDNDSAELSAAITEAVETALMTFLAANVGLSLVFSSMLQYLWGLINTL